MKPLIVPSIIAKNQKELNERLKKVHSISNIIHLDVMDGKFVKNKSFNFDFKLNKDKKYVAHLMLQNPRSWIKKNLNKVNSVLIHIESKEKDLLGLINYVKSKNKGLGLVINPKTPIMKVKNYVNKVAGFLVMAVQPGKYGSHFKQSQLKKIKQLKNLNKNLQIGVDGGINHSTIKSARSAGADIFVIGSYFQKAKNPKKSYNELIRLIES